MYACMLCMNDGEQCPWKAEGASGLSSYKPPDWPGCQNQNPGSLPEQYMLFNHGAISPGPTTREF